MRWAVKLNEMTGDILPETLAAVGYTLDGDMLSGEPFEAFDEWGDVADLVREMSQKVREIARLSPDIDIGFTPGPVFEISADGQHISEHRKVWASGGATIKNITAQGAAVVISSWKSCSR